MSDLDPTLRALIDAASPYEDPTSADRARLRAKFVRHVGAAAFASAIPTLASSAAAGGAASAVVGGKLVKTLAVFSLLGAMGGGIVYEVRASRPSTPRASVAAPPPSAAAAAPEPEPDSLSGAPAAPSSSAVPQKSLPPRVAIHPSARPSPSSLDAELLLIARAQSALNAHDPTAALALLDEHASLYPQGQLAEEREGLRVLAECSLGRDSATRKAEQFLRSHPQSPLATRIRKTCGPR